MWRNDFPIFENYTQQHSSPLRYLDSAATSMKPNAVIKAMSHFMETGYGSVHRGAYRLSVTASEKYEQARQRVAQFIGPEIDSNQVIFTRGTTESLNLLAAGFCEVLLTPECRIVVSEAEHHSNMIPWQQAAKKSECEIAYVSLVNENEGWQLNMEQAERLVSSNTKVVSVAHVGNVLGQTNSIAKFIELSKKVGAFCVVDCAQSAATHDINFLKLGADAVVFSAHKLFGPTGLGVLVLSKKLLNILPPYQYGGSMVSSVTLNGAEWSESPTKYEAGTPPLVEAIGLHAAIDWIESKGKENLKTHANELGKSFLSGLKEIKNVTLYEAKNETGSFNTQSIFSFRHNQVHAHDVATILDSHHIAVRAGHHCAWPLIQKLGVDALVRVSFGPYCAPEDVSDVLNGIKNLHKVLL
jgi:cysteine desulfurase / selenocysteine lyase